LGHRIHTFDRFDATDLTGTTQSCPYAVIEELNVSRCLNRAAATELVDISERSEIVDGQHRVVDRKRIFRCSDLPDKC